MPTEGESLLNSYEGDPIGACSSEAILEPGDNHVGLGHTSPKAVRQNLSRVDGCGRVERFTAGLD